MKTVLCLLLALGLASANSVHSKANDGNDFKSLLADFLKQANFEGMVDLYKQLLAAEDPDLMTVITFLKKPEVCTFYKYLHASDPNNDFPNFLQFLKDGGLDIDSFETKVKDFINCNSVRSAPAPVGTIQDLLNKFLALVDTQALLAWALDQLASNTSMQALLAYIQDNKACVTYEKYIKASPEWQDFLKTLADEGIDISSTITTIEAFLGWTCQSA